MGDLAPRLRFGFDDMAAGAQVDVMEEVFPRRWNAGSYAGFLEQSKDLPRRELACPLGKFLLKLPPMLLAFGFRGELHVGGPRRRSRFPDHIGHGLPFGIARTSDDDPAVL